MSGTKTQLDPEELTILAAVRGLNLAGRTTNNSQVASESRLNRTRVATVTTRLSSFRLIENTATGNAYHWQVTPAGRDCLAEQELPPASTSHSEIPEVIQKHFDRKLLPGDKRPALRVAQTFSSRAGWLDTSMTQVPTYTVIRELSARGVTSIGVQAQGADAIADFPIEPLLAETSRPLLGGGLIGGTQRKDH